MNWDQTGIKLVPASDWTMAEAGSRLVEVRGLVDDKREITPLLTARSLDSFSPLNSFMQVKLPGVTLTRAFLVAGISTIVNSLEY